MLPPIANSAPDRSSGDSVSTEHWLSRFSERARTRPLDTALIAGSRSITCGDLESWSDRIALKLQESGIGAGDFVGAGFHRSAELIAGLLGIIKSGAAYIPIDPSYPQARISQMLDSARLKTMLSTHDLADSFPRVQVLRVEDLIEGSARRPAQSYDAARPVYAIFTSGSTGQPKAATVFHSGFANLLDWYDKELALETGHRSLIISSPSFDLTQKNLFTPLITGGVLVLDDCQTYDITRILGLIREHQISLINCTPSAFYPLVDAAAKDGYSTLATLRFAILGGEPISTPRLRSWLEHSNCRAEIVNSYGPTECTDICLFHRMDRRNIDQFSFVPLGLEISNVGVTIRDENLAILPDGEIGELCISGAGIGGGYLHDPVRTAERFTNGIYRTGDLAKCLPCSTFEFRGRADHQVKVNGFRIELGEIEIALNRHQAVREAVVTASENKLTAYIEGTATDAELRAHLTALLPSHMIPSEFHNVENFPLTPNGKVDRKALIEYSPSEIQHSPLPSDGSLESRILALWSEILGHNVADATANFFDIGGNSIHLAVIHVRLKDLIGRDFPITDLFALPNARAIAKHLSPSQETMVATAAHDRARLAKSGFARFQRPFKR